MHVHGLMKAIRHACIIKMNWKSLGRSQFTSRRLYYIVNWDIFDVLPRSPFGIIWAHIYNDKQQANGLEKNSEKSGEKNQQQQQKWWISWCMVCNRGRSPHFVICHFEENQHNYTHIKLILILMFAYYSIQNVNNHTPAFECVCGY